jgi:hypothetical protein
LPYGKVSVYPAPGVNNVLSKTLLGSPFKLPLLVVLYLHLKWLFWNQRPYLNRCLRGFTYSIPPAQHDHLLQNLNLRILLLPQKRL